MNYWLLIAGTAVAFFAAFLVTPFVRAYARRFGLVDKPDAHRKIHAHSVALGGGIAVMIAASCALLMAFVVPSTTQQILRNNPRELAGMLGGMFIICCVGLWDDKHPIRARYKLLGQILAAVVVVAGGLRIGQFGIVGQHWSIGWFGAPLTVFWIVLCVNAMNLIDGADGLATTVAIVLFGTIAAISVTLHQELSAFVALMMCGALLGFLRYNFPPASIFLGDTGSMAIGFLAGTLAVHTCIKGAAAFALTAPLAMWVIPLLDISMAVVRRKLTGRGLSTTDRLHLHHSLLNRGISNRVLLLAAGSLSLIGGLGAWLTVRFFNEWFAILSLVAIVVFLASTRLFGHIEMRLVRHHLSNIGSSLVDSYRQGGSKSWSGQVRMQGDRDWDCLWSHLVESGESLRFLRLRLDLNLPWMHEGFHAAWVKPAIQSEKQMVRLEWPLLAEGRRIGTLSIHGESHREQALWLAKLAEFLIDLEERVAKIYCESLPNGSGASASAADTVTPETFERINNTVDELSRR